MYKIIGADGKIYGPASLEQLRRWIAEGRANALTRTQAESMPEWKLLGALPEFAGNLGPPIPSAIQPLPPGATMAGPMPRTNNSLAIAGLIFGILSLTCCCGFPLNLLGLIFSLVGLSQIHRQPERYEGRGFAIAGLVLSAVSLCFTFGILLFNLLLAPLSALGNF